MLVSRHDGDDDVRNILKILIDQLIGLSQILWLEGNQKAPFSICNIKVGRCL